MLIADPAMQLVWTGDMYLLIRADTLILYNCHVTEDTRNKVTVYRRAGAFIINFN